MRRALAPSPRPPSHARARFTATRASAAERIAALTSLDVGTLEAFDCDRLDARAVVRRLLLLRSLVSRGDVESMIRAEPMLLSPDVSDEDLEHRARDALEALALRVRWRNVREFLVEREPSLLLGVGGSMRLDEIRDFAVEHESNLDSIAGDGEAWLSVNGQRFVENFLVRFF